jgi:hypothetical protein
VALVTAFVRRTRGASEHPSPYPIIDGGICLIGLFTISLFHELRET